jgi:hypothetical protein
MRTGLIAGLLAGTTAVITATLVVVPAQAGTAATWTVSPGGAAAAKAITGTITLTDTSTGAVGTCASSKAKGRVKSGTRLSGNNIGVVTAAAFGSCVANGSVRLKVTTRGLPWRISFTTYRSKTAVVVGTVSRIEVVLTGLCDAVVNGSSGPVADGVVRAIYNDQVGQLTFLSTGGNLHYWHVQNCGGLINDGDPVALTASYKVRPIQDITSP